MTESTTKQPEPMTLNEFLEAQKLHSGQWDLLLMGDGSGLQWEIGGGFACFLIDGRLDRRDMIIGARTRTTVNRMELAAYTEALSFHYQRILGRVLMHAPYKVWIFSDSDLTVKSGNRQCARKTHGDLWQAFEWFEARGYAFQFRWVPRNSTPLHELADDLAGKARKALNDLMLESDALRAVMPYAKIEKDDRPQLVRCSACGTPVLLTDKRCPICDHEMEEM